MNERDFEISRRRFLAVSGAVAGSAIINTKSQLNANPPISSKGTQAKQKIAIVGTGGRGVGMWGGSVLREYSDQIEFVGLCDINPGRLELAKKVIGNSCPTYLDSEFDKMMKETKPDILVVTTTDDTHDYYIKRGMELGANIICEKPMAIDEKKIQSIIDAEKNTKKDCRVTFNYRYSPHRAKIWETLRSGEIGDLTSVDFHWYLDTSHGADYFRRWHRLVEKGGSLWVHKASHHFDLLNWWIESDPESVYALGELEFYGENGPFRAENCRNCPHTKECDFYWDIMKGERNKQLYVDNEKHDGYLRDGCVFRNDINIDDKMAATVKYKNGVQVAYSLTTYSPYEGYRVAFNGTKGRIDAWIQESNPTTDVNYDEIIISKNFGKREYLQFPISGGHSGGDKILKDQIFIPNTPDPLKQVAGIRDGALACLVGIAARKSIQSKKPVMIKDLTTIVPQMIKEYKGV